MVNKYGFMLTEQLLIVLTLSSILLLTPIINTNTCEIKLDQFINSLKLDLNYGMNYSLTNFKIIKIRFYPNESKYVITDVYSEIIRENNYDQHLLINSYIQYNMIEITHGNVVNSHYFYISCGNLKYKITVYEKSGILNVTNQ